MMIQQMKGFKLFYVLLKSRKDIDAQGIGFHHCQRVKTLKNYTWITVECYLVAEFPGGGIEPKIRKLTSKIKFFSESFACFVAVSNLFLSSILVT